MTYPASAYYGLDPDAPPGDPVNLLSHEALAMLMYRPEEEIYATLQQHGLEAYCFNHSAPTTYACIAYDRENAHAVVSFRGSANPETWRNNLILWTAEHPAGGRMHAGFAAALFESDDRRTPSLAERIDRMLQDIGATSVALSGHSRGGAEAQALALYLTDTAETQGRIYSIDRVVTFNGAPFGNATLNRLYEERLGAVTLNVHTSGNLEMVGLADRLFRQPGPPEVINYDMRWLDHGFDAVLMDHSTAPIREALHRRIDTDPELRARRDQYTPPGKEAPPAMLLGGLPALPWDDVAGLQFTAPLPALAVAAQAAAEAAHRV